MEPVPNMFEPLNQPLKAGDKRALARAISLVENEHPGFESFLAGLEVADVPVVGITGPPGAGKSTLTNELTRYYVEQGLKVAILCIDPSGAFHKGAILADRVRMNAWYLHPRVYIRSLASRGSLGGLAPNLIEVLEVVKSAGFDQIFIETVGVGQAEVDIALLADHTVVVLVPEAGDGMQAMKAGLLELAEVYVVNKSDRPGAGELVAALKQMLSIAGGKRASTPVLQTSAGNGTGIKELAELLMALGKEGADGDKKRAGLLAGKLWKMIAREKMKGFELEKLQAGILSRKPAGRFNLYSYFSSLMEQNREQG